MSSQNVYDITFLTTRIEDFDYMVAFQTLKYLNQIMSLMIKESMRSLKWAYSINPNCEFTGN